MKITQASKTNRKELIVRNKVISFKGTPIIWEEILKRDRRQDLLIMFHSRVRKIKEETRDCQEASHTVEVVKELNLLETKEGWIKGDRIIHFKTALLKAAKFTPNLKEEIEDRENKILLREESKLYLILIKVISRIPSLCHHTTINHQVIPKETLIPIKQINFPNQASIRILSNNPHKKW